MANIPFLNNVTFAGSINLTDNKPINYGGQTMFIHTGSQTRIGDSTSSSVLTIGGGISTFAGNVTIAKSTPVLTFNNLAGGGLDPSLTASGTNFTISTSSITPLTIALDTGNATFAGNVSLGTAKTLNFSGTSLQLLHDGTNGNFINNTGDLKIQNSATDKNIIFKGNDGGTNISALTLDMSDGGWATFNSGIHVANTFSPSTFGKATFAGDLLVNTTGGYFEVDVSDNSTKHADNTKAKFGTGNDLEIYHDGDHSYIQDTTGTGDLRIDTSTFRLRSANGGETMIRAFEDSSVVLSYNTFDKLSTIDTGISVTGNADVSSTVLVGTNNSIFAENNLRFKSAGAAFIDHNTIGTSIKFRLSSSSSLDVTPLEITPTYVAFANVPIVGTMATGDNSTRAASTAFVTTAVSSGVGAYLPLVGGTMIGEITMPDNKAILFGSGKAFIKHSGSDMSILNDTGNVTFTNRADNKDFRFATDNGSGGTTTYLTIDGLNENITFSKPGSFLDGVKAVFGNSSDLQIYHDGTDSFIQETGAGDLYIDAAANFFVRNQANGEVWIKGTDLGVSLRYQDDQKIITTPTGVEITGNLDSPSISINEYLTHNGDPNTYLQFPSTNDKIILSTNGSDKFTADANSAILLEAGITKLQTTGTGIAITGAATATTATIGTSSSATLTTKSYVDGLVTGVPVYKGTWDASGTAGGTPDLRLAANKVLGNYYIVSTAGSATPNGAGVEPDSWNVGDWCIFSDVTPGAGTDLWQKIDNTSVISGAGTGQSVTKWEGTLGAASETLTDGPITFSTNDSTFAGTGTFGGNVTAPNLIATTAVYSSGIIYGSNTLSLKKSNGNSYVDFDTNLNATFAGLVTASKNQNATSSFTFQNTDTTGTAVRTHLFAKAGNRSIRLEAIHSDYSYVVSNNSRMYFQTNDGSNNPLLLDGNNATFGGNVTISNASPALNLTDTDNASNIAFSSVGGALIVNSASDQVYQIGGTEEFRIASTLATFQEPILINSVLNYTGLEVKGTGAARPFVQFTNFSQGNLGGIGGTELNGLILTSGTSGSVALTLDSSQNATFEGDVEIRTGKKLILQRPNNGVATEISTDSTGAMVLNSVNSEGFFFNNNGTNIFKLDPVNATFTGLVSGITPVAAANFVTKAYVDGSGGGTGPFLPLAGGTMNSGAAITFTVPSAGGSFININHTGNEAWTIGAQSGTGADDYLDIGISGGTRAMSWHETGNVGIGTTSPSEKLDTPNIKISGTTISGVAKPSALFIDYLASGKARLFSCGPNSSTNGGYDFNTGTSAGLGGTLMTILGSGNVGIGTTSPSSTLQVSGEAYVTGAFGQGVSIANKLQAYGAEFRTSGASAQIFFGRSNSSIGSGAIGADSTYVFRVWKPTDFSNPFVIEQSGDVGIGITSPQYKLDVANGGIQAGGKVTYTKSAGSLSTTGYAVAGLTTSGNGQSAGFTFTCFGGAGKYQKLVYSCYNSVGTWNAKKVIDEGTNDLDVVASANGSTITFTFRAKSSTQSFTPRVTVEAVGTSINSTYA